MKDSCFCIASKERQFVKLCKKHRGGSVHFTGKPEIDALINNVKKYPHLFVLACLMDRQIKAERAWEIPYLVCRDLCGAQYEFSPLAELTQSQIESYFQTKKLHRYNDTMSHIFYKAVQKIAKDYAGNASKIWVGNNSANIIYNFLCFEGCGIKIASMATNLLHRIFGVKYTDYSALDISPDIHIRRVLFRLGFIEDENDINMAIYRAKSINPQYPGLLDECCWNVGRRYCDPSCPNCIECELNIICDFASKKIK